MPSPTPKKRRPSVLGYNVSLLRKERGLTQQQLADRSGLIRESIAKIETGKQQGADLPTLESLARAMEVSVPELFIPEATRVAMADLMRQFDSSSWAEMTQLSEDERRWLLGASFGVFRGIEPSPALLHHLVMARRAGRSSKK